MNHPRGLTPRELEVLELSVNGVVNKLIARKLKISHRTVEQHTHNIRVKLGAVTLMDTIRIAVLENLVRINR